MRTLHTVAGIVLMAAGAAWSAEAELDTDWMQTIEDTNKNLSSNIALKNAPGATSDARELGQIFGKVEAFFVAKGDAHDAVALSKKSVQLSDHIVKSVSASDFDAASHAATDLSRTCRTCHTFFKKS